MSVECSTPESEKGIRADTATKDTSDLSHTEAYNTQSYTTQYRMIQCTLSIAKYNALMIDNAK